MKSNASHIFHAVAGKYGQLVLRFRSLLVVATHLALIVAAHLTAFTLRFEGDIHALYDRMMWRYLPAVLAIYWGVDVEGDDQKRLWLAEVTGPKTVPQIFVDGRPLGGFSDIDALDRQGKLDPILRGAA